MNQDTLVFYSSKIKFILWFLLLTGLVILFAFLAASSTGRALIGLLLLSVLTGLAALLYLYLICRKSKKLLIIGPDGIQWARGALFSHKTRSYIYFPWNEIEKVDIWHHAGVNMSRLSIGVYSVENLLNQQQDEPAREALRKGIMEENQFVLMTDIFLPISRGKLKNLINERLQQYREQHPQ